MTVVNIKLRTPSPDGTIPADSRVSWQPVERLLGPDYVVLKARTSVAVAAGAATVEIEPGVYWFTESAPGGEAAFRVVPPVGPVNYRDLAAVDPVTLEPGAAPAAAWYAYTDGLEAAAQDAAGSAEASQLAAEGSQASALASATASGNSATASAGSASAADLSRIAAGNSAAAASGSANSAAGSASTATARAQEAANSASAADASKDDAATSAFEAAVLRDTMVNGGSVDVDGHLILARVGAAPVDAGYVVGPAPIITVADTVTGPETPGATGAQGVQGLKGDPGGLVQTSLGNVNLNTVTAVGAYRQANGVDSGLANNYPKDWFLGSIIVLARSANTRLTQFAYPQLGDQSEGRVHWERGQYADGLWTPWRAYTSTRLDTSAGRALYQWDDLNNREQLVYGDTGWRNVDADAGWTSALFTAGSVTQAPGYPVRVRRIGYNVEVHYAIDKAAAGPVTAAGVIPLGFRPVSGTSVQAVGANSGLAMFRVFHAGGVSNVIHQSPAAISGASTTLIYSTIDPWPTTLPGSAVGSIPNV